MSKKKKKRSKRPSKKSSPAPVQPQEVLVADSTSEVEANPPFPRWTLWTIFATSLVGMALALYASYQTINIRWQGVVKPSACSVNSWINCDAAHASSYAFLFGLPIAWWGFLYYVWSASLAFCAVLRKKQSQLRLLAIYASCVIAIVFTLSKALTLFFQLKVLCLICLAMYIVNIALFLIMQKAVGFSPRKIWHFIRAGFAIPQSNGNVSWLRPSILYTISACVLIVGGLFLAEYVEASYFQTEKVDVGAEVKKHFEQDTIDARLYANAPVWGNPNATVTLIEFSDFQCPYCQHAAFHLRSLLWQFRDQVRLYFVHFPLDHTINRFCRGPIHEYAGLAARAAVCAQERGKFWEFHDELFSRQDQLKESLISTLCKEFGWDEAEFMQAMNSERTYQRVRDEIECAGSRVRSTPSLVINGRLVEYWGHPDVVQSIVREELRRTRN